MPQKEKYQSHASHLYQRKMTRIKRHKRKNTKATLPISIKEK